MTTFQVIILSIANHLFAVPMNTVLQVRRCPPELRNSLGEAEWTYLEDRPLLVLNLQLRLGVAQQISGDTNGGRGVQQFLVLTQSSTGVLCGLKVDRLPDMLDLPARAVQALPESYRQNNLQGLAKYVAILPREEKKLVIYLLDLEQILQGNSEAKPKYPVLTS